MKREDIVKKAVNGIGLTCSVDDCFSYYFLEWLDRYRNIKPINWSETDNVSVLSMINFIQHHKVLAESIGDSVVFWTSEMFNDCVLYHIEELEQYQKCESESMGFIYYIGKKSDPVMSKIIELFPNIVLGGNSKMDFSEFLN